MELKRSFGTPFIMAKSLLIVPYGIETQCNQKREPFEKVF